MDKRKSNHLISVDSETGVFWHGKRQLRTRSQVDVVINQTAAESYVTRGQTLFYFGVMKIIRTTSSWGKIFQGIRPRVTNLTYRRYIRIV